MVQIYKNINLIMLFRFGRKIKRDILFENLMKKFIISLIYLYYILIFSYFSELKKLNLSWIFNGINGIIKFDFPRLGSRKPFRHWRRLLATV
jgi:hypothetical protein